MSEILSSNMLLARGSAGFIAFIIIAVVVGVFRLITEANKRKQSEQHAKKLRDSYRPELDRTNYDGQPSGYESAQQDQQYYTDQYGQPAAATDNGYFPVEHLEHNSMPSEHAGAYQQDQYQPDNYERFDHKVGELPEEQIKAAQVAKPLVDLKNRQALRNAVLYHEILSPPRALRDWNS